MTQESPNSVLSRLTLFLLWQECLRMEPPNTRLITTVTELLCDGWSVPWSGTLMHGCEGRTQTQNQDTIR